MYAARTLLLVVAMPGLALPAAAQEKKAANHWAWKPLLRVTPPVIKKAQIQNPIDAFIRAKLTAKGLKPSKRADRRPLLRRVTFDLTGLPPTPEEVDAFLSDKSPNAYEKIVDRLLASPHYGERWGRHWLDVVHYGDTHGYDKDKRRDHAWPYRDYVIRAFNTDKPFSRFLKEQVAGDALYPTDPDGVVATGFLAAGPWDFVGHLELAEGTVEKAKTRLLDRDDMVANVVSTFNSVTVHCARCHDHKFDPVPQRDYYRLQAVFAGVERGDRPYDTDTARMAKRTELEQKIRAAQRRQSELKAKIQTVATTHPEMIACDRRIAELQKQVQAEGGGDQSSPSNGYHSGIEASPNVEKWVQIDLGKVVPVDEVRLIPARPTDFPDTPGFGFPPRIRVALSTEPEFKEKSAIVEEFTGEASQPQSLPFVWKTLGRPARFIRVTALELWKRTGDYVFALGELQALSRNLTGGPANAARTAQVTALDSIEGGLWSKQFLVDNFDSRYALPDPFDPKVQESLTRRAALGTELKEAQQAREIRLDSLVPPEVKRELAQVSRSLADYEQIAKGLPAAEVVYTIKPIAPRPIQVLARGDVEQPREKVGPGALSCLTGLPSIASNADEPDEGKRRVWLAEWLASPKNSLTWRSIVNRVWHYHFGRGLVDTPNDFGLNGSRPTHPELLDWLAATFRDGGQSFKKLHRLIVTSATYCQSSADDPQAAKVDGDNRYLWRMNRLRLEAEEIRDSVLAVSGALDLKMGGPGVELFRFKDDHSPVYDHSALDKINDPKAWRRTVYAFTVRSVPNPFLECLDCADPNINTPVRNTTLTALQALALLNNPFMVRQAELFAARLQAKTADADTQIALACKLAFGRSPRPDERIALIHYAQKYGLANACRLLYNANEFIFLD